MTHETLRRDWYKSPFGVEVELDEVESGRVRTIVMRAPDFCDDLVGAVYKTDLWRFVDVFEATDLPTQYVAYDDHGFGVLVVEDDGVDVTVQLVDAPEEEMGNRYTMRRSEFDDRFGEWLHVDDFEGVI